MSKKLLFNFNREVIQNYTYVKYVGTIITATNTLEKPIKSAILKGSTKYRDIDTGEILETFEEGRNLELVSVKMPVLTISNEDDTKTNILTVNEDVELRGIGDVRDELDLLSGEVTERIGEIVLDGVSIIPTVNRMGNQNNTIAFDFKKSFPSLNSSLIHSLNDTFPDYSGDDLFMSDVEGLSRGWDAISVRINKNRLAQANVEGFKQWLQSNPITVQYQLKTPTIKTVDLSILDQNENKVSSISSFNDTTHIMASSETIPPIFEGYLATKEG